MIQRVRNVLKSDLVKVSSKNGAATMIKLAGGFIISKLLAVFVGPAGLAMLGQLTNVNTIIQALSTGGISIGVTKYISEHAEDEELKKRFIVNALRITFLCSCLCSIITIVFYKAIALKIFGDNSMDSIVLVMGGTLLFFSFNTVISAILNGLRNFKLYVLINIVSGIVTLVLTLILVLFFKIYGALLAVIVVPSVIFFISWFLVRKEKWATTDFLFQRFDLKILKSLGRFSLMALNNAIVGAVAQIFIRTIITGKLSKTEAGIWDGMNRMSAAYLLVITTGIQVYYLPVLSFIKDKKLLWKEIVKTEKIILPITLLGFIVFFLFRSIIVDVLFSKEFSLMKSVMGYQLLGDFLKVSAWILSYTMYAKAMTKQLIISDNVFTF